MAASIFLQPDHLFNSQSSFEHGGGAGECIGGQRDLVVSPSIFRWQFRQLLCRLGNPRRAGRGEHQARRVDFNPPAVGSTISPAVQNAIATCRRTTRQPARRRILQDPRLSRGSDRGHRVRVVRRPRLAAVVQPEREDLLRHVRRRRLGLSNTRRQFPVTGPASSRSAGAVQDGVSASRRVSTAVVSLRICSRGGGSGFCRRPRPAPRRATGIG